MSQGRRTPPRRWLWLAAATAVVLLVLWLLFTVVFPWVERLLEDPTVGV